jgi:ubiquinone/menaquinone biosynthesis C-methylase UbiE
VRTGVAKAGPASENRQVHTLRYDAGASAYDRLTGRWSRTLLPAVLDAAAIGEGAQVLDVATGTGDAALAASPRTGANGRVVGVDLSIPMLREAQAKARGSPHPIELIAANAQKLPFVDGAFDVVLCLFGLMFFPDRGAALQGFRRLLRPGGRLVVTTWGTPAQAPYAGLVAQALAVDMPADRDDLLRPFSMADPDALSALLRGAAFRDVEVRRETRQTAFTGFDADFWEPIEAGGGRLGQAYLALPAPRRTAVRQQVLDALPPGALQGPFTLDLVAWLAVGTA